MVKVRGSLYQVAAGDRLPFTTSFCRQMMQGLVPQIAHDVAAEPGYRAAAAAAAEMGVNVGAYVGIPIARPNGELFGTLCGFSPDPDNFLSALQPLMGVFSALLAAVLEAESTAEHAVREAEKYRSELDVDALTGLLNRRGWDRYVGFEEQRHRRFGGLASIVMLDLDRLKQVNDRFGHAARDEHIRGAAAALRSVTRSADVLARLGGDEFAVLAVGADEQQVQVQVLVGRMQQALAQARIAGTFGAAPYTAVAGFPGALVAADEAMYQAKRRRRPAPP
jgi:diguanylate cyclase (GGDEF)-like protein